MLINSIVLNAASINFICSSFQGSTFPAYNLSAEVSPLDNLTEPMVGSNNTYFNIQDGIYSQTAGVPLNSNMQRKDSSFLGTGDSLDLGGLQSQDSFGRWVSSIIADSPGSVDDAVLESSISSGNDSFASPAIDQHQSSVPVEIFVITDFSPSWAFSTETTKVCFPFLQSFVTILWCLL